MSSRYGTGQWWPGKLAGSKNEWTGLNERKVEDYRESHVISLLAAVNFQTLSRRRPTLWRDDRLHLAAYCRREP